MAKHEAGNKTQREAHRLVVFALGSFNLGLMTLLAIAALHAGGGLDDALGALNTLVGMTAYAVLWGLTTWGVHRGLRDVDVSGEQLPGWLDTLGAGARSGGLSGLVVLGALAVVGASFAAATAIIERNMPTLGDLGVAVLALAIYPVLGGGAAFFVGSMFGAAVAFIDSVLLTAAAALEGSAPTPTPPA